MAMPAADENHEPVTLHRVMQSMIGEGLRSHYQAPQQLSHELFVLLLQLKEEERKGKPRTATKARSRPVAPAGA